MAMKRLRSGKTIESKKMAYLSGIIRNQISESVREQTVETMRLPSKYSEETEKIRTSGYAILRTGHRLYDFCSIASGDYILNNKRNELCGILSLVSENARPFFKRKNIILSEKFSDKPVFVNIDGEKFCYALLEILHNAAKNSFSGSAVKLSLSSTKKYAKITVADKGTGMDTETTEHCFEPFFCGSAAKSEDSSGLGLSLARHFAEESKGRIKILSEKGKGTSVSMFIPLAEREEENLVAEAPPFELFGGIFSPVYIMLSDIGKED